MKYSNCILTGSYSPIYVPIEDGETENEREKGQVGGSGRCSGGEWSLFGWGVGGMGFLGEGSIEHPRTPLQGGCAQVHSCTQKRGCCYMKGIQSPEGYSVSIKKMSQLRISENE